VASAFAASPERVNQHITIDYETYLKREPDSGGSAFWLDQLLRLKKTNEDLISGLIVSDEFFRQAIL
jgi:hypothetical protein